MWSRAWLGPALCPALGAAWLFSTGALAGGWGHPICSQQLNYSPSTDHPSHAVLSELPQSLLVFLWSLSVPYGQKGLEPMAAGAAGVLWEQPGMLKHPESGARNRNECITFPGMAPGLKGAPATPPSSCHPNPSSTEPLGTVCDGHSGRHSSKGTGGLPTAGENERFLAKARGTELTQMEKPNTHPKRKVVDLTMVYFLQLI